MQRMFSTFPNGWPGRGLLLLRFAAGVPLCMQCYSMVSAPSNGSVSWINLAGIGASALVVAGYWTPLGAAALAMIEAWYAFGSGDVDPDHTVRALVGLSLVMLGPGSWSVDARLYGRKRIDLGR